MDRKGLLWGISTTTLLLMVQYGVLWLHPAHTLTTIALQLGAIAVMLAAIFGVMWWRTR